MSIIKLNPAFKDYIWGGTRLKSEFGKKSDLNRIAESWELSAHHDGESIVASGKFAGKSFSEYLSLAGYDILGSNCQAFKNFPVLIKLIDAKDNLSIQVHPDDEYALRAEGEYGKTEMWYVVDCEPQASLIYGFKKNVSADEFLDAIRNDSLLDIVNEVTVKKGDVFFINAGTLHAIGKGILIAEIQQNSNTTYRVYDYNRLGTDGMPRALHVDKALDVTNTSLAAKRQYYPKIMCDGYCSELLGECEYFNVQLLDIFKSANIIANEKSFNSLLFLEGCGEIKCGSQSVSFQKGDSCFVPANSGEYQIFGKSKALLTKI